MRFIRSVPRNRSRTKLGAAHSCSRAASATSRASSALTLRFGSAAVVRSEEHTSELQSPCNLVCRLLLEKKKKQRSRVQAAVRSAFSRGCVLHDLTTQPL